MATCGVCIEIISDKQQITCLPCGTNFHLCCVEEFVVNGVVSSCPRRKNVPARKKTDKTCSRKSTSSRKSGKSVQLELDLLKQNYELEKRQLSEQDELLRKKHDAEREYLQNQSLLLKQIEDNDEEEVL